MLGDVVRETRIKRGLTQAKLARLAGVSRRHLAALEKGANVSVLVLRKVASVLDLEEIELGELQLRTGRAAGKANLNVAVLADTIREARADVIRTQSLLAQAEGLIAGNNGGGGIVAHAKFPRLPVRRVPPPPARSTAVAERGEWLEVKTSGELRQGEPIDETKIETISLPSTLIEKGEIVLRARGQNLCDLGIADGDLLVVQLRQKGRAASGELAIGKIGNDCYVGRWWDKHGQKALMSDGLSEVTVGKSKRVLKVVAVINAIVREDEESTE